MKTVLTAVALTLSIVACGKKTEQPPAEVTPEAATAAAAAAVVAPASEVKPVEVVPTTPTTPATTEVK